MSKFTFTSRGLHQWQPLKRWTKSTENDFKDVELIRVELDWDNIDRAKGKDFYLESYSTLCSVIDELASRTFKGRGNLSKDAWAYRYPDEFYNHARAVARPDPHAGHWEDLLRVQEERIFLVRAVIMKAIGETVLSEDLFVADHRHEKMLSDDGTASLTRNSVGRSHMRASMNKELIDEDGEDDGIPPRIWEEVDKATAQIAAMLLPLYDVVGETDAADRLEWPQFYQSLHNIVAYAGWINVASSISSTITLIEWVQPGHTCESDHVNAWNEGYQNSVALASANDVLDNVRTERAARVKINAFPRVTQVSSRFDGRAGYMRWKVADPVVVLYQGHVSKSDDDKASRTLSDHVRLLEDAHRRLLYTLIASVLVFSVLAIVCFVVFRALRSEREPKIYGMKRRLWLGFSFILGRFGFCNRMSKFLFGVKC